MHLQSCSSNEFCKLLYSHLPSWWFYSLLSPSSWLYKNASDCKFAGCVSWHNYQGGSILDFSCKMIILETEEEICQVVLPHLSSCFLSLPVTVWSRVQTWNVINPHSPEFGMLPEALSSPTSYAIYWNHLWLCTPTISTHVVQNWTIRPGYVPKSLM